MHLTFWLFAFAVHIVVVVCRGVSWCVVVWCGALQRLLDYDMFRKRNEQKFTGHTMLYEYRRRQRFMYTGVVEDEEDQDQDQDQNQNQDQNQTQEPAANDDA